MYRQRTRALGLALLLSTLLAGVAQAGVLEQAQADWLAGKREQALQSVQAALSESPQDARLRFALAVMQMESGRADAAEALLLGLTQDFPDLADPYNNLAVIRAGRGELEGARRALEQALALQPEHVQAQENLGDVLLRLALQAYERAQKLSISARPALELKLSRTRELARLLAPGR